MRLIAEGHHLAVVLRIPGVRCPPMTKTSSTATTSPRSSGTWELNCRVAFVTTQWESGLSRKPYIELPPAENPNVVTADGKVQGRVSPFGPVAPWCIGRQHTDEPWMKQIQQWYPSPPLVVFLSNNEHAKLNWTEADTDQRIWRSTARAATTISSARWSPTAGSSVSRVAGRHA